MRVEPYGENSIVHTMNSGSRGMPIVLDKADYWRFVRLLFYANDTYRSKKWEKETDGMGIFDRPNDWPERKPLVKILAWVLLPNHFHLLLKEIQKSGISSFMQGLTGSMSMHFNTKYGNKGTIFRGSYKSRTVNDHKHLMHLVPYILVKNVFEVYPKGGYESAVENFEDAWQWAVNEYKFSSLANMVLGWESPILDKDIIGKIFDTPDTFLQATKVMLKRNRVGREGRVPGHLECLEHLEQVRPSPKAKI